MENNWYELALEECMEAIIDYRGKTPEKTTSGIPLITAKIIKAGSIQQVTEFIAEKEFKSWMRRGIPKSGDIVMTTEAPLGEVAQLDGRKIALAQRVITLRGKTGLLDNTFLKYLLMSHEVQHQLEGRATGTTVKGIKQSELRQVVLQFPDFKAQKAIAHILGTLDDKIELNRQMNATLEGMAQALFKSWFVDFDPVIDNALAAGNPIPEPLQPRAQARAALGDQRKPLPEALQKKFPDRFVFNEDAGWVPEGWPCNSLSNFIKIKHGYAFKGEYFSDSPTSDILLTPGNFKIGGGFKGDKLKFYNGPVDDEYILSSYDIIISMTDLSKQADTLGFPAYVPKTLEIRYLHNQRLGKVEFIDTYIGREYLFQIFCSKSYRNEILSSYSGTTVKHTSPNKILAHKILQPKKIIVEYFELQTSFLTQSKSYKESQNEILIKLRDSLLPKLLSGQLRIPDAEKLAAEVV